MSLNSGDLISHTGTASNKSEPDRFSRSAIVENLRKVINILGDGSALCPDPVLLEKYDGVGDFSEGLAEVNIRKAYSKGFMGTGRGSL